MRINPAIANQLYLNYSSGTDEDSTCLATGTYSNLAAAKYVKDNDKNGDGAVSADEVSLSAEAYALLDADADGKVTRDEMKEALAGKDDAIFQYYKNGGAASGAEDPLTSLDEDDSDADSTGKVYSDMAAVSFLAEKDTDDSGKLSAAESGLTATVTTKLDTDKDGSLSLAELKTGLADKNAAILKYYQNGGTATASELTSTLLATI